MRFLTGRPSIRAVIGTGVLLMISSLPAETGSFKVHRWLHEVGEERYEITTTAGGIKVDATFEYSDRGRKRGTKAALHMNRDYSPLSLELSGEGGPYAANIHGATATVQEQGTTRTLRAPERYFTISGSQPFVLQMMMMRYWKAHGRPASLQVLHTNSAAELVQIRLSGHDSISVKGKTLVLERYTMANLAFGREILWMNATGDLAVAMTFADYPTVEVIRDEYASVLPQLYRSGVAQEMADLTAMGTVVSPERVGAFAISGATLVDGTGAPPVEDSVVIVRDGRIVGAGPRDRTPIPHGMAVVDATGQTLLPGLWEMHTHFSGVEFGPALLAAGVTTARDCGGEFDYLVAQRDAVARRNALGPRLLLAGLVDAGGLDGFGHVTADTVKEGQTVVDRYHASDFQQIKVYSLLKPEVVKAIALEAHRVGMTITGHVPQALNTFEGVEAGMDQINHLSYVSRMMCPPGSGACDVNSEPAKKAIQFLQQHQTVIDPTVGWEEMRPHPKDVDIASFEPGVAKAPSALNAKFRAFTGDITDEDARARTARSLSVIGALHKAGIPMVPGTDTGLVGYGLDRELELYVKAGMTPLEAIQSATIVSARAMNLDRDSGTVEPGKRADLILIAGNPLLNISDIRKVSRVVTNGRLYDTSKLWRIVGFHP